MYKPNTDRDKIIYQKFNEKISESQYASPINVKKALAAEYDLTYDRIHQIILMQGMKAKIEEAEQMKKRIAEIDAA